MTDLYAAAYLAPLPTQRHSPPAPSEMTRAFYKEAGESTFPYDIGDDPAFYSASYHHGPITWGVCRADVRQAIAVGDWIVFFSSELDGQNGTVTRYRFVAALCVENKLRHTSLFQPHVSQSYSSYLNLLIRPSGTGWEHFEPALNPFKRTFEGGWHGDWSWRICEPQRRLKEEFVAAGKRHVAGASLTIGEDPLQVAENYIVFSTTSAVLVSDPPLVATHRQGDDGERWETGARSDHIRRLVFADSSRGLRTRNVQQPHRHFRRRLDDPNWPDILREAVAS
jgi:hypothetical protein